jgi:hypothetical protein
MVLYPIEHDGRSTSVLPAWVAIEQTQWVPAKDWWLIAQPDHAALSGELARRIDSPCFPALGDEVIQGIALHDEGWAKFDGSIQRNGDRPLSFLEAPVPDFLAAWRGSIAEAENNSAIGGTIVSEHFCRIAKLRPVSADPSVIDDFLRQEKARQERLSYDDPRGTADINLLVDVLQFCDLLSLYLCCGSQNDIEFPQRFKGRSIRLRRAGELCRMEPAIFGKGASLAVLARRFSDKARSQSIPLLLG